MFEEIEKSKKHGKTFAVLGLFVLVATVIGVAVAAYTWSFTGSKNTIGTGTISMSLLESTDSINITNALPMGDTQGIALTKASGSSGVFDFAITTHASGAPGNITYTISIAKLAVDSGYTALANNQVKVYLAALSNDGTTETQVMAPTLVSNIISSGDSGVLTFDNDKTSYLTHVHTTANTSHTQKYRLKMWIDSSVDASSWTSSTKNQYKLKISTSGTLSAE